MPEENLPNEEVVKLIKNIDYNLEFFHKKNNELDKLQVINFISDFKFSDEDLDKVKSFLNTNFKANLTIHGKTKFKLEVL